MNTNYLIAVVDDDQHIRNLVEAYLQKKITARLALAVLRKHGPYGRQAPGYVGARRYAARHGRVRILPANSQ